MPFFGVRPPPQLCSRRPNTTFVPRSRHCTSRDALEALMVLDALFGVGPPPSLCSRRPHRTFTYRSRHRARRSYKLRRALIALPGSRCPSLSSDRRHCCGLAVHTGRLQYRSCHRAGRSVKSRRAVCAHGARCPSLGVGRRRSRCALSVHIGRLQYRSRHCAGRSFKSRRVHGALMVLDALFGVRPPPQLCSRRPHWTFVPLSPSCKAGSFKSRRARCLRSWFSMPFFGVGRATVPQCSRRPHRTFVPLLPSCKAIVQVETRSLCAHGSRCPLWRQATATAVILPLT
jgi:hypothetical protein